MTTPEIVSLAVIVICLTTTLVLSTGEVAISIAARTRFAAGDDPRAALVQALLQSRERLTQSIFIARNLSMGAVAGLLTALFLSWFGLVGIVYVAIAVAALALLFSRVLPKTIASYRPDRVALLTAKPVSVAVSLFGRVTPALEEAVRAVLRLAGIKPRQKAPQANGHEELRGTVDLLHREGSVVKSDRDMFGGLLDLQELEVSDVMVHRTSMVAIHADDPPEKIVADV